MFVLIITTLSDGRTRWSSMRFNTRQAAMLAKEFIENTDEDARTHIVED